MQPSPQLISYIMQHEGFMPRAYLDPPHNTIGQYSIGYGHQIRSNEGYLKTAVLDKVTAQQILAKDLAYYVGSVNNSLKRPVTQSQFDALVDLAFNAGTGNAAKVISNWNATGDTTAIANEIRQYNHVHVGGMLQVDANLTARRAYEAGLFTGLDHAVASVTAGLTSAVQKKNGG